jgi:hypothetical protein
MFTSILTAAVSNPNLQLPVKSCLKNDICIKVCMLSTPTKKLARKTLKFYEDLHT